MNEEEKIEGACERILAKLRAKPSPEAAKIIREELPPLVGKAGAAAGRAVELSRETEQLLGKLSAKRSKIDRNAQLAFSGVLGGALSVWLFFSGRGIVIFLPLVAAIPVGAFLIGIRWVRRRREVRDLETKVEQLEQGLQRTTDDVERAYAALTKLLEFVARMEVTE